MVTCNAPKLAIETPDTIDEWLGDGPMPMIDLVFTPDFQELRVVVSLSAMPTTKAIKRLRQGLAEVFGCPVAIKIIMPHPELCATQGRLN